MGWLTFQEDGPNVKTNPLANHGGLTVNAIEECELQRPKQMKDVVTSRRFIFEALQKAGMISLDGTTLRQAALIMGVSRDT